MNLTFSDFLKQQKGDATTIQEAAILYVGELTDDLPPEKMKTEVVSAAGDLKAVEAALDELRQDSKVAEKILVTMFTNKWEEPAERERIKRAFEAAGQRLPVIETIVIGSIALYAMYLTAHFMHMAVTGKDIPPPAPPSTAVGALWSLIKGAD